MVHTLPTPFPVEPCRTEEGQPLVLAAVKQAEQRIVADGKRNKVR